MDKLKPCPFCGEDEYVDIFGIFNVDHDEIGCYITCLSCGITFTMEEATSREEVIEAWNNRAGEENQ